MRILAATDTPMATIPQSPQIVTAKSYTMQLLEIALEPQELEGTAASRTTPLSGTPFTNHKHYRGLEAPR